MSEHADDEDLEILLMMEDWTKRTHQMAEDLIQQINAAIAEEDEEAADRLKIQYPPCPICGAEVTSYEFVSIDGPVVMEFRPCGSKVIRDSEIDA